MRRLTRAESAPLVAEAKAILRLYIRRMASVDPQSAQSLMPVIADVLRRGCEAGSPIDVPALSLSPTARWCVDVTWVLKELGRVSSYVMLAHLGRRTRPETTWLRIARELEGEGYALLPEEVSELYRLSVPQFVYMLHERGITRDIQHDTKTEADSIPSAVNDPNVDAIGFMRLIPADLLQRALAA